MEIVECGAQVVGAEVRPQRVDEAELGVGRFPEQEIRQPLFAAGADEEIDVVLSVAAVPRQQPGELLARGGRSRRQAAAALAIASRAE